MKLMDNNVLWYKKPAQNFNESLPLGNGRIGACLYGGVAEDIISLNEDTLWSGYPKIAECNKDYPDIYKKIRELVLNGKVKEAQILAEEKFGDFLVQMFLPLGKMKIQTQGHENASNYKRELHMDTGVHKLSYKVKDDSFERLTFISEPAQVMVTKIKGTSDVNFTLSLESNLKVVYGSDENTINFSGNAPVCVADFGTAYDSVDKQIYSSDDKTKGVGFFAAASVTTVGGTVTISENKIVVKNATEANIFFAVRTSFSGWDKPFPLQNKLFKEQCLNDIISAKNKNYSDLLNASISSQQTLYNKCCIKLAESKNENIPTDELLENHKQGNKNNNLYVLLFNYGKYLLTAASRNNTQPANLQGIWNEKLLPKWNSNYTLNINTEMNYWPVLPLGMFECYEPLIKMVEELSIVGKETAENFYGANGWVCHHSSDIWRLTHPGTNRLENNAQWGFWNMASGWLSVMLWNYYTYTADIEYLKRIYPVIEGAAEFYRCLLVENNGKLILSPSTSPENNYINNSVASAVDKSTAMSQQIIYDLFSCVSQAQETLGFKDTFSDLKYKLKMPSINKDGTLCEWDTEHEEWEKHHRHVSLLYGLFPSDLFDTSQKAAAEKTLVSRGDDGTGWSLAWKINLWARLGKGEHALALLDRQLQVVESSCESTDIGGGSYPNLFCAHPPFQIDGNFGACSGIINMLLQVKNNEPLLLPALPESWKNGEITGIRIPGNKSISFKWVDGKVTEKSIKSL